MDGGQILTALGEKGLFLLMAWLMAGGGALTGIAKVRQLVRPVWSKYNAWEGIRALKGAGLVRERGGEPGGERFELVVEEVKKIFSPISSSGLINFESQHDSTTTRGKNFFSNVSAFEAWEIQTHERVLRLADMEHVTPGYIEQMACNFFHHERRGSDEVGMLIWRLENKWVPEREVCYLCGGQGQTSKYTSGAFGDFVNVEMEVEHE